ncbi:MAG: methyltransferase domain-containing protein [Halobacteriales archaeon]|nr:methyltransferase domain-containing protein [Halobacteriales archaeon]
MGHHTFDAEQAATLEDPGRRYRYVSREELLWKLALDGTETVADLGSGTGFYTDDVAAKAGHVYGIDIQPAMHDYYRQKTLPDNVELVETDVASLPFADDALDAAVSTMTYHEFASDDALTELSRAIRPDGRLVVADWSTDGEGEAGPPLTERYGLGDVTDALQSVGFKIELAASRPETLFVAAVRE